MATTLYAPSIIVNGVSVGIKPNSFTYTEGFGERNVRNVSAGGNQTSTIISENLETQMSKGSFILPTTAENVAKLRTWQANKNANAVEVTDRGGFTRKFQQVVITNDPEIALGVDGEVTVEFMSRPAV